MSFDQILGQENAIRILRKAFVHRRLAHAHLFVGPEGVGKRLSAFTLAKAMNCLSPPREGDSCEHCPSCLKINSQSHADVIFLGTDGAVIKIEQIRELQKRLSYQPLEGGRRACILDPADRLNEAAANALLKTLEEPPEETYLFLITAKPHQVLPTIRSRCQWVKFKSLGPDSLVRILTGEKDLDDVQAHFLASLSGGSAEKARALANRMNFEKRLEWLNFFGTVRDLGTEEIFSRAERMAKEGEETEEGLDLWTLWIRDLIAWKIGGKDGDVPLLNRDLALQAAREASQYSFGQLEALFDLIARVQKAVAMNANLQLALEAGLLEMRTIQGGKHPSPFSSGREPASLAGR